ERERAGCGAEVVTRRAVRVDRLVERAGVGDRERPVRIDLRDERPREPPRGGDTRAERGFFPELELAEPDIARHGGDWHDVCLSGLVTALENVEREIENEVHEPAHRPLADRALAQPGFLENAGGVDARVGGEYLP